MVCLRLGNRHAHGLGDSMDEERGMSEPIDGTEHWWHEYEPKYWWNGLRVGVEAEAEVEAEKEEHRESDRKSMLKSEAGGKGRPGGRCL